MQRAPAGHRDRRGRGQPGPRPAGRRVHRHRPAAGAAARRPDRVPRPRRRRRPLRRMVRRLGHRRAGGVGGRAGGRPAARPLPARPGAATTRWACTQTLDLQDRPTVGWPPSICSAPASARSTGVTEMRNPALDAWGDYDRDNPFPLFAQVRADGPVHEVTLADGHAGVADRPARGGHGPRSTTPAVQGHARRARPRRGGGRRGPARSRLRPAHAQRRPARPHPAAPAGLGRVQPVADRGPSATCPGDRRRPAGRPRGRGDTVVDLVEGFAFPLPFTVISELLGVPEPDRDQLGAWFTTLLAPSSAPEPPAEAVAASANIVRYLTELLAASAPSPARTWSPTWCARPTDGALSEQEMLSTIFQLVVAGHDTTTSLIGNGTVALLPPPRTARRTRRRPGPAAARDRGNPAMGRTRPALDVPLHHPGRRPRRRPSSQPTPR